MGAQIIYDAGLCALLTCPGSQTIHVMDGADNLASIMVHK